MHPLARFVALLRPLTRYPAAAIATLMVLLFIGMALSGAMLAPYRFDQVVDDTTNCLTRSNGAVRCAALKNAPPSAAHPLGTDRNGRDVLSRLLHGARETMGLPALAALSAVVLGTLIGLTTGYYGGWLDEIVSRLLDSLLAIPALVLALVVLATIVPALDMSGNVLVEVFGAVPLALILVITLLYTPIVARVIRSAALALRDRGYVEAARLRGESVGYILLREILPGVLPALLVEASLRFSYAIFLVTSLGFLGLGAQPPSPEWGRMVLDARSNYATAPWALWSPVVAIALLIISVNVMTDGLRRVLRYEQESFA
jgi:peptide/nickel transport system permease protein